MNVSRRRSYWAVNILQRRPEDFRRFQPLQALLTLLLPWACVPCGKMRPLVLSILQISSLELRMKHIKHMFTSQNCSVDPFIRTSGIINRICQCEMSQRFPEKNTGDGMGDATILRLVRLLRLARMTRVAKLLRAFPEVLIMIKGLLPIGSQPWGSWRGEYREISFKVCKFDKYPGSEILF